MCLEGRAIAVSETVTLPAQPTTGVVDRIPLGGDGYSAPMAAYAVVQHQVTGAVGGGSASLQVNMDPRFCSLISYITMANEQVSAADADVRLVIFGTQGRIPVLTETGEIASVGFGSTSLERTWNPTPVILPGGTAPGAALIGQMLNVDADVYKLSALIYLFKIDVRERTPMGPLLWARGAT